MACGVLPVRNWWRSSPVTMSLTQWRWFSTVQCPRARAATCSGRASVMGSEQTRVDDLDLLLALDGAGAPDPDHLGRAGEVDPGGGLDGFDGAQHPPPVGVVGDGDGRDVLPGQFLELPAQTGLVALDRQKVVAAAGDDPLGLTHLGAPWRRRRPEPRPSPTARAGPSGRGSRWTHPTPAALPRRLRRPGSGGRQQVGRPIALAPGCAHGLILHGDHPPAANTPTLVRIQADTRASRSPGSTRRGTRLIVDWRRQGPPDLQAQSPRADRDPGRRRARASPPECGTPPGRPPRPGTRPRPGRGRTPRRSRGSATP